MAQQAGVELADVDRTSDLRPAADSALSDAAVGKQAWELARGRGGTSEESKEGSVR